MRRFFLYFIINLVAFATAANDSVKVNHLVKVDALGFSNKVRITYEHPLNKTYSAGGVATWYYRLFPGFKAEPYCKYYIDNKAPQGIYLQGYLIFSYMNYFYYPDLSNDDIKKTSYLFSGGLGAAVGWQYIIFGAMPIDISVGLQYHHFPSAITSLDKITNAKTQIDIWHTTGPGAILNPRFGIGLTF